MIIMFLQCEIIKKPSDVVAIRINLVKNPK